MENITLKIAIESYKFGFNTTYDGDNHTVLFGTECNHCGNYFEYGKMDYYCPKCRYEKEGIKGVN